MLDMDTGGGERLLELKDTWPPKVVVTEAYPPNNRLVHERLAPLGVAVFDVNLTVTGAMPFATGEFDVVLNRHAAFNPAEVERMLAQRGTFLTQQVHGRSTEDLIEAFDSKPQWPFATPEFYVPQLEAAGLTIDRVEECSSHVKFADVGAIVYYLRAAPWLVPDFSVDSHLHHLRALQARLEQGEELAFVTKSYLIEASKRSNEGMGATDEDH